jgi:hypothetical protein
MTELEVVALETKFKYEPAFQILFAFIPVNPGVVDAINRTGVEVDTVVFKR